MDKKTGIAIIVIGVLILGLVALAFGLESGTKQLTSEDILRINNEVYKKAEFEEFIRYTLYENDGKMEVDEEAYADEIAAGTSNEDLFISDTLNKFYQMKVFDILAKQKNIVIDAAKIEEISGEFNKDKEKILSAGLTEESYKNIEKQQAVVDVFSQTPGEYIELPDEMYEEYIASFSGDDLKSYTYRMLQVSYEKDKVSGEGSGDTSGEVIPGNKDEKKALVEALVNRYKSGESFEKIAESGDNRLIFTGNNIEFAKSVQEYSAGFLLSQKLGGSEDAAKAVKNTKAGNLTEIIDTDEVFQLVLVEKVEDGIVGKAKDELVELMISQYASDLVYQIVKDMEVNNSAVSRIKIK